MQISKLKQRVIDAIELNAERIVEIGEKIFKNPEMGYREYETSALVKSELERLGIPYRDNLALTGVKGIIKGRQSKARVAILGEMDAIICPAHPDANPINGAAHACGHNAQIAAMIGAAIGLSAIKEELDGDVCIFAVPAEEYAEIGYRVGLKERGDIEFFGGKQELIRIGEFDDVDMAMMIHAQGGCPENTVCLDGGGIGFIAKTVNFIGKAAHAGGAPHEGINALNAAMAAMMCIHAQRETFRDEDKIRVHPIITNGGELVNVVPSLVTMETYVRGATLEAISDASEKVDRAIKGACMAIGAECEINNYKGYLPLIQNAELSRVYEKNTSYLPNPPKILTDVEMTGSTDIGDLGHMIPIIQPTVGGFVGNLHTADFRVSDKLCAYVDTAKTLALTAVDLLSNNARVALSIKESFKPLVTKNEYIKQ